MRTRTERLKSRGDQLRAHGLSVSATLELYAGAVICEERSKGPEAEEPGVGEEDGQLIVGPAT